VPKSNRKIEEKSGAKDLIMAKKFAFLLNFQESLSHFPHDEKTIDETLIIF
jgi:hypothetical protein